ncbi:MAG: cyclodeaminase/cyclohydrolase family protein [Phycisphaerales bacterium]|nr:cyclodeaminase/cyclohydrolase family protein [Phycisphaerales bacterium]
MTIATSTVDDFLETIDSAAPTPGGGAVAGVVGALAAALGGMVVHFTLGRKTYAAHATMHQRTGAALSEARRQALALADADAAAYGRLNVLWKLPEDDPQRRASWDGAVDAAIDVPLRLLGLGADVLAHLETLVGTSNRMLRSDLGMAAVLAEATIRSAAWNVSINLPLLTDRARASTVRSEVEERIVAARAASRRIEDACRAGD